MQTDPEFYNPIIGMTADQAEEKLKSYGIRMRITAVDGSYGIGTADFRQDRLNVQLTKGLVSEISGFG